MPLPHNLFDYCSIRKSNFIEKYLVVKRKISFVYKADILLTKLIIRVNDNMKNDFRILRDSLKNVEIILYDELLERFKNLKNRTFV